MPIEKELAEQLSGTWKVELHEAPMAAPLQCCFGCFCTCCAAYQQRNELLDLTGEPYVCCSGLCPCGPLGEPQDRKCLVLEACCCPGLALSGNRFMVQTRFDKMNTACDDCILTTVCLCDCVVTIGSAVYEDFPEEIKVATDCLVMATNGCMHAQQHVEIREIEKSGYDGPSATILSSLPPLQQSMISQGKACGGEPQKQYGSTDGGERP
mmetsp:Transcript_44840/g.129587  ORF Transcript_44840/g.129587 Transcript_44840/m.129587 type:complete len:210 (-) Transcript_44840:110-739(-)